MAYAEVKPNQRLADVYCEEVRQLGRESVAPDVKVRPPLGNTAMSNVTQVLPGIHPVVGVNAAGATVHQRAFAAVTAGPSGDRAVIDGTVMLVRTIVCLAETPDERDRVLAAQQRRCGRVDV